MRCDPATRDGVHRSRGPATWLLAFGCHGSNHSPRLGGVLVFLVFSAGGREAVRLNGTGRFFCLHCEKERSYQRREWQSTDYLFFIPVSSSGGEFIRCDTCGNAFNLECLNESSTASFHELLADAPDFAIRRELSAAAQREAAEASGVRYAEPKWERGSHNIKSLSAKSVSRRH